MNLPTPVTTRTKPKFVSWSYSKIKNWRTCPKRHYEVDIAKRFKEPDSDALAYGNVVHQLLDDRIVKGTKIPDFHAGKLEPWAQKVLQGHANAAAYNAATGQKLMGEQGLAITDQFQACEYFDKQVNVWFRAKIDVLKVKGPVAVAMDWKTGKIIEDSEQLLLSAQCIFAHFPEIQVVRTMFVWLAEDGATTNLDVTRDHMPYMWAKLLPEIQLYVAAVRENSFEPRPSGLCRKYCPVRSCPHYGEGG